MPKPKKYERENKFLNRCIPKVLKDNTAKTQKQAVAICYNIFEEK